MLVLEMRRCIHILNAGSLGGYTLPRGYSILSHIGF